MILIYFLILIGFVRTQTSSLESLFLEKETYLRDLEVIVKDSLAQGCAIQCSDCVPLGCASAVQEKDQFCHSGFGIPEEECSTCEGRILNMEKSFTRLPTTQPATAEMQYEQCYTSHLDKQWAKKQR